MEDILDDTVEDISNGATRNTSVDIILSKSPTLASALTDTTTKTSTKQPALMDLSVSSQYCISENSSPLSVASLEKHKSSQTIIELYYNRLSNAL